MIKLEMRTIEMIEKEILSIPEKYQQPFNSKHEGYAVLLEEVRELENEIFFGEKKDESGHKQRIREEAVQVAAMACRIIQELT